MSFLCGPDVAAKRGLTEQLFIIPSDLLVVIECCVCRSGREVWNGHSWSICCDIVQYSNLTVGDSA